MQTDWEAQSGDVVITQRAWLVNARFRGSTLLQQDVLLGGAMIVQNLEQQTPFPTKDGSTIRSILDRTNAPVQKQSLAEARLPPGEETQAHYHRLSEEIYFIIEGSGVMTLNGATRPVRAGDGILIPASAWHTIHAVEALRFLCCCAPPYSHADTYFE